MTLCSTKHLSLCALFCWFALHCEAFSPSVQGKRYVSTFGQQHSLLHQRFRWTQVVPCMSTLENQHAAFLRRRACQEVQGQQAYHKEVSTIAPEDLVVVKFSSSYCYNCKIIQRKINNWVRGPGLDKQVRFVNVDLTESENSVLEKEFDVTHVPYFQIYKGSEGLTDAFTCSASKFDVLLQKIGEAAEKLNT
mmetsp:Transcript_22902/g.39205  ORF Transcript_22902/g.39205 Transcript_22902/m.39205 type:complete len:192 (+) Transcript_22902:34-609(+)